MRERMKKIKLIAIVLLSITVLIGCGSEPSPLELMKAPIRVVRNDSITQVEDSDGRLYVLNVMERTDYATAFLDLGEELIVKGK